MEQPEAVLAVRRMQQYIEEHIKEPITMLQLARAAGYSPFHSASCSGNTREGRRFATSARCD
jgi:AraC-like DNA-binding protein